MHGQTAATLSSMEKKKKKESRWQLSLDSFSNGAEMLMAESHACAYTCARVCCVCAGVSHIYPYSYVSCLHLDPDL